MRLPKELTAESDRWSSTWLPAITLSIVDAASRRVVCSRRRSYAETKRRAAAPTDGVVQGLSALSGALTRGYRSGCSPFAGQAPFVCAFRTPGASGGWPLLQEFKRRRKGCCCQPLESGETTMLCWASLGPRPHPHAGVRRKTAAQETIERYGPKELCASRGVSRTFPKSAGRSLTAEGDRLSGPSLFLAPSPLLFSLPTIAAQDMAVCIPCREAQIKGISGHDSRLCKK